MDALDFYYRLKLFLLVAIPVWGMTAIGAVIYKQQQHQIIVLKNKPAKVIVKEKIKVVVKEKVIVKEKIKVVVKKVNRTGYIGNYRLSSKDTIIIQRSRVKSARNNNPGNLTCMGGLRYGAIGIAYSMTGDKGDQKLCIFKTRADGLKAMRELIKRKYSNKAIKYAFRKYQTDMVAFKNKLKALTKIGIDVNKRFTDLTTKDQKRFVKLWCRYEGVGRVKYTTITLAQIKNM